MPVTQPWTNTRSKTIPGLLKEARQNWPKKIFLDFSGEKYTFEDVDRQVTRLAHGFAAEGVVKGDCVCYFLDSSSDAIFIWFAVNKLGAIAVPINTDFRGDFLQ